MKNIPQIKCPCEWISNKDCLINDLRWVFIDLPVYMFSNAPQLFGWIGEHFKSHITVFGILSIMAIQGVANFQSQRGIVGDFSNLPQEQLLEWINANTMPSESCHVRTYS